MFTYLSIALWELIQQIRGGIIGDNFRINKDTLGNKDKLYEILLTSMSQELMDSPNHTVNITNYSNSLMAFAKMYLSELLQEKQNEDLELDALSFDNVIRVNFSFGSVQFENKNDGRITHRYHFEKEIESSLLYLTTAGSTELTQERLKKALQSSIQNIVLSLMMGSAQQHYAINFLPTSRINLLSMWKYVIIRERIERNEILERIKNQNGLSEEDRMYFGNDYSEPTRDWIDRLEQFDNYDDEVEEYADLLVELEEIINGKITFKRGLEGFGRKRYFYVMDGTEQEIPLHQAASSVNQLALLYLYLKHFVRPNRSNTLFIDEPEMNLHPDNQVKLVNLLMKFANRNDNCVYVATHSPYITDTINNHILVGYLQEQGEAGIQWLQEHLPEHDLEINPNLNYKDFAVYNFSKGGIHPYEIGEYGIHIKDFYETKEKVHDATRDILDGIWVQQEELK